MQVSKTGWAYILDRATGEPLIGIDERGKVRLSMKAVEQATGEDLSKKEGGGDSGQQEAG